MTPCSRLNLEEKALTTRSGVPNYLPSSAGHRALRSPFNLDACLPCHIRLTAPHLHKRLRKRFARLRYACFISLVDALSACPVKTFKDLRKS